MGNTNSGRGGLPPATRREIERRLASGQETNTAIARAVGVNVSTVQRIKRQMQEHVAAENMPRETVRCGGCGGLVLVQVGYCLACYQEKTIFAAARRRRVEYLRRADQKARETRCDDGEQPV